MKTQNQSMLMLKLHRNIRSNEQQTIANINCTVTLHHFTLHFILARARVVPYLIQFIFGDFLTVDLRLKYMEYYRVTSCKRGSTFFFSFFSSRINIKNIKKNLLYLTAVSGRESTAAGHDRPAHFTQPSIRPGTDSTPIVARN